MLQNALVHLFIAGVGFMAGVGATVAVYAALGYRIWAEKSRRHGS